MGSFCWNSIWGTFTNQHFIIPIFGNLNKCKIKFNPILFILLSACCRTTLVISYTTLSSTPFPIFFSSRKESRLKRKNHLQAHSFHIHVGYLASLSPQTSYTNMVFCPSRQMQVKTTSSHILFNLPFIIIMPLVSNSIIKRKLTYICSKPRWVNYWRMLLFFALLPKFIYDINCTVIMI
jgi:hypothetical protein